jgi:hypothetical protein
MLEILQFYVSSFWVWAGLTFGISVIGGLMVQMAIGAVAAARGR